MNKISKRLTELAKLVDKTNIICDVGTDHGYLSIHLIKEGLASKVIASDLRDKPLEKCLENVKSENLLDKIEIIKSSGVNHITNSVDLIIFAGMGGILISEFLQNENIKNTDNVLIQANTDNYLVRKTLMNNGFTIKKEAIIYDNDQVYNFIYASIGKSSYSELELKYGPVNINNKSDNFLKFINDQLQYFNNLIKNIPIASKRYIEINQEINDLLSIIEK